MPSEVPTTKPALGRLQRVGLREVWPDEAVQFTPWLASAENLGLLGETIGMELIAEGTEAPVGGFAADIVARNVADNSVVVIENQLEQTDHAHLGQILTYLAGVDAKTVIWIARRIRDEHRAAVEWLNTNTIEAFRFFAIEVELWRIGESSPAPRFSVVVKPNAWIKAERAQQTQNSPEAIQHLIFWTALKDWTASHQTEIQIDKPSRGGTIWIPVVGTPFLLSIFRAKGRVGLFVRPKAVEATPDGQDALKMLATLKPVVVGKLGLDAPMSGHPRLEFSFPCDPDDTGRWDAILDWLTTQIDRYSSALKEAVSAGMTAGHARRQYHEEFHQRPLG
jgi:hypothetical protein